MLNYHAPVDADDYDDGADDGDDDDESDDDFLVLHCGFAPHILDRLFFLANSSKRLLLDVD